MDLQTSRSLARRLSRVALVALSLALGACAQIIGIEDTELGSDNSIRKLVFFFSSPVVEDTVIPLFVLGNETWESGVRPVAEVEGRGDLFFDVRDCDDATVAGLTLSVTTEDEESSRFFFLSSVVELEGSTPLATDGRGAMGVFNLPSGPAEITVSHRDTAIVISRMRVFITADANTTFFMRSTETIPQASVDMLPGNFDCRVNPTPPTSVPSSVAFNLMIQDFNAAPVPDIDVDVCPTVADQTCSSPETSGMSGSDGLLMLSGNTAGTVADPREGFKGYLVISGNLPSM